MLKNATNFKSPQLLKCHKFKSAANVPFYSYFFPSAFLLLSYFLIIEVLVFPMFSHSCTGQPEHVLKLKLCSDAIFLVPRYVYYLICYTAVFRMLVYLQGTNP